MSSAGTLLLFTNGVATEKGRFFTESEGLQAYHGYHDMQSRGPQGVAGVPLSRGNEGPPGAVILPDGRKNYPPKTEADSAFQALLSAQSLDPARCPVMRKCGGCARICKKLNRCGPH